MENKTGLDIGILKKLQKILKNQPEIEKTLIFGSRARGDFRKYSDIDLAIFGNEISFESLGKIRAILEELPTIYEFDIVHFESQTNEKLKLNILKEGLDLSDLLSSV